MVQFHRVTIGDKPFVDKFVFVENSRSADFNFGNIYLWDTAYFQFLSCVGDRLLTKLKYEELPFFAFPIGSGDLRPAIEAMEEYVAHEGYQLRLRGVTDEHRELLEGAYPGLFSFEEDRACFDYIYLAEKLATFSGKKLHGKRNFCNRFEKEHKWEFRRLTRSLFPTCMEMLGFWQREFDTPPDGLEEEHGAIIRALMRWDALGLEGGVLFADDMCVGFTVGEKISGDTFDVHFEKAYADIPGAYPMVCREFARQILSDHPEVVYINREDDMGHENLRSAKLEYYPEFLLRKYTARITDYERI